MVNLKTFSTKALGAILFTGLLQNAAFGSAGFQGTYGVSFIWTAQQPPQGSPGIVDVVPSTYSNTDCQAFGIGGCDPSRLLPPSTSITNRPSIPEAVVKLVDFYGGMVNGASTIGFVNASSVGLSDSIRITNTGPGDTIINIGDASYSYDLITGISDLPLGSGGGATTGSATVGFDFTIKQKTTDLFGNLLLQRDIFSASRSVSNGDVDSGTVQFNISPITVLPNTIAEFYINSTDTLEGTASVPVPEPSPILGLFALGTLGAASTLKRKLKPSKSTEKEKTKVG